MKVDLKATAYASEKAGDVKRLRKQGKIPAVLYGHGEKSKLIYLETKEFKKVLNILKKEAITVNLKIDSKNYVCVIKAIQHNPVTGELLHVDFQHIHKKEKIRATVPIHPTGEPPGVKQGGILDVHLHEVVVKCLPDDMPSHIDVDISNLDLGHTIHLEDIRMPNVDFELTPETPVVSILIPRKIEEEVKPAVEVAEEVAVGAEEGKEGEETKETEKETEKPKEGEKGKGAKEGKKGEEGKERKGRG
jgi:large subunit ribosomal protein L25